jgi:hypothetical protein
MLLLIVIIIVVVVKKKKKKANSKGAIVPVDTLSEGEIDKNTSPKENELADSSSAVNDEESAPKSRVHAKRSGRLSHEQAVSAQLDAILGTTGTTGDEEESTGKSKDQESLPSQRRLKDRKPSGRKRRKRSRRKNDADTKEESDKDTRTLDSQTISL